MAGSKLILSGEVLYQVSRDAVWDVLAVVGCINSGWLHHTPDGMNHRLASQLVPELRSLIPHSPELHCPWQANVWHDVGVLDGSVDGIQVEIQILDPLLGTALAMCR